MRAALQSLSNALVGLVGAVEDGGLDHLDPGELVDFLADFEQVRNRLPLVDHRALRDAEERHLAAHLGQATLGRALGQVLRLSAAETSRRIRAAEQLGLRISTLGEAHPARRPLLAAAQRDGILTPHQSEIALRGFARVDRAGFDPADLDRGEENLTALAATLRPERPADLRRPLRGPPRPRRHPAQEQLNADRRHLDLRPQPDGSWRGEFQLTGPAGARLHALLGPLAKPRPSTATAADGRLVEEPDSRTRAQRLHDALDEVCSRLLRAGSVHPWGGVPATVVVTIEEESLRTRTGTGTTSDGTRLSVAEVLKLADQAEIIPTVLNKSGALLTLGRSRRIASRAPNLALTARDRGCSPECVHPPRWCERHHIVAWIDGGATNLNNLTLLCRYHHQHVAVRGWSCRRNLDGLPE